MCITDVSADEACGHEAVALECQQFTASMCKCRDNGLFYEQSSKECAGICALFSLKPAKLSQTLYQKDLKLAGKSLNHQLDMVN